VRASRTAFRLFRVTLTKTALRPGPRSACAKNPGYDGLMAVTAQTKLDAASCRRLSDLRAGIRGKPLAYLDSAVSSHKPRQVLDKLRTFYETSYANVHRGVYTALGDRDGRIRRRSGKVAQFVNAPARASSSSRTAQRMSINLVAYAWGLDQSGALGTSSSSPSSSTHLQFSSRGST